MLMNPGEHLTFFCFYLCIGLLLDGKDLVSTTLYKLIINSMKPLFLVQYKGRSNAVQRSFNIESI